MEPQEIQNQRSGPNKPGTGASPPPDETVNPFDQVSIRPAGHSCEDLPPDAGELKVETALVANLLRKGDSEAVLERAEQMARLFGHCAGQTRLSGACELMFLHGRAIFENGDYSLVLEWLEKGYQERELYLVVNDVLLRAALSGLLAESAFQVNDWVKYEFYLSGCRDCFLSDPPAFRLKALSHEPPRLLMLYYTLRVLAQGSEEKERFVEAAAMWQRAAKTAVQIFAEGSREIEEVHLDWAASLISAKKFGQTLPVLDELEFLSGSQSPVRAAAWLARGRVFLELGQFDEAWEALKQARELSKEIRDMDPELRAEIQAIYETARCERIAREEFGKQNPGAPPEGELFDEIRFRVLVRERLSGAADLPFDTVSLLGVVLVRRHAVAGEYHKAKSVILGLLALMATYPEEEIGDRFRVMAAAALGENLRLTGDYRESEVVLRKARKEYLPKAGLDPELKITLLEQSGFTACWQDKLPDARRSFEQALALAMKACGKDSPLAGKFLAHLATVASAEENWDEACMQAARARAILDAHRDNHLEDYFEASVLLLQAQFEKAVLEARETGGSSWLQGRWPRRIEGFLAEAERQGASPTVEARAHCLMGRAQLLCFAAYGEQDSNEKVDQAAHEAWRHLNRAWELLSGGKWAESELAHEVLSLAATAAEVLGMRGEAEELRVQADNLAAHLELKSLPAEC